MNTTLHRPRALITGGAKRIGAAIAWHLAARGYDLVLHYHRSQAEAEALAAELTAHGATVTLHRADLSQADRWEDFWRGLPPCELVIFSAATYQRETLDTVTAGNLRQQLTVNFEAPLFLTQGFMAQLPDGVTGQILVLGDGTMGGKVGAKYFSYALSKHAWFGAIEVLAASVAPRARAHLLALPATLPNPGEEAMFKRLSYVGSPAEICAAIDRLLGSDSTGEIVRFGPKA